jgi:Tfp pilus assembly protein PilF
MLLGVGDTAEAWRQLSTMIERDPMSGTGYEAIANVFEREGKVAEALDYWEHALRIDQTDPTPRLRKAQALYALGRNKEGDAALRDITNRRWHERWEWTVENARELLEQNHAR